MGILQLTGIHGYNRIVFPGETFDPVKVFDEVFKRKSGYSIPKHNEKPRKDDEKHLLLIIHSTDHDLKEGYSLHISPVGIIINANNEQGVFYAFQSLRQIMRMDAMPDAKDEIRIWKAPAVHIIDQPLFSYRGMHLDVCRHFFPVDFVKKYIDLLAYYKMNRFHWHLTDDQGWRLKSSSIRNCRKWQHGGLKH
jgi:hexosaminidase